MPCARWLGAAALGHELRLQPMPMCWRSEISDARHLRRDRFPLASGEHFDVLRISLAAVSKLAESAARGMSDFRNVEAWSGSRSRFRPIFWSPLEEACGEVEEGWSEAHRSSL